MSDRGVGGSYEKKMKRAKEGLNLPAPATPTVAAPAPMYLAAESISLRTGLVWIAETWLTAAESGLKATFVLLKSYIKLNSKRYSISKCKKGLRWKC